MVNKTDKKQLFFAYQSKRKPNDENINAINRAKKEFNKKPQKYYIKTWEDYVENGKIIGKVVVDAIEKADAFACDVSSLNFNVLFELGFAVGKRKQIYIFLNKSLQNSEENYKKSFLQSLTYTPFTNARDICKCLKEKTNIPLLSTIEKKAQQKNYLYINTIDIQSSNTLTELLKDKDGEEGIVIDRVENPCETISFYIQKLLMSNKLIVHNAPNDIVSSYIYNAENSFLAGLAYALNMDVAILSDDKKNTPLDYQDLVISYTNDDDCCDKVIDWIDKKNTEKKEKSTVSLTETDSIDNKLEREQEKIKQNINKKNDDSKEKELNILRLGSYFYSIAEEEKDTLADYFIPIDTYNKAKNAQSLIVYGRKGVGKSAIYYKILSDLHEDKKNLIVELYPDTEDISNNISFVQKYSNITSRQSFFMYIWRFIIYSKLAIEIYDKDKYKTNDIDYEYIDKNREIMNYSFTDILKYFNELSSEKKDGEYPNIDNTLLNIIMDNHIKPLIKIIKKFLQNNKYSKIFILADNLDKFWKQGLALDIQSSMISALFDIRQKIIHELKSETNNIFVSTLIFLRNDIFDFILSHFTEPDKISISSEEINWSYYKDKILMLIENRFKYALKQDGGNNADISIETFKQQYFELKQIVDPIETILQFTVMRPRDILLFFSKLFESAINRNRSNDKIRDIDFKYAMENYLRFYRSNLITELSTEFVNIEKIIDYMVSHDNGIIEYAILKKFLKKKKYIDINKKLDLLIESLYKLDFIYITEKNKEKHINIKYFIENKDNTKYIFFKEKTYVLHIKKLEYIKKLSDKK